ncbi:MAG TPA: hypothetical protein VET82_01695 [Candidatus Eisenbacteria bacterium]|nr:hypothetical protein [Candidatus Eisenbacteria bacterium]
MDRQIEYVGGQPDRPPVRPWWLLAVVPAVLIVGLGVVVAGPGLADAARSMGQGSFAYTVQVRGTWTAADQVVGSPADLVLDVKNTDSRSLNGISIHLSGLSPRWTLTGASPDGQIAGTTLSFPRVLRPGESETLTLHLLAVQSGASTLRLSMTPAGGGQTIHLVTDTGAARGLSASVTVREATATDLGARPKLYYNDANLVNQAALFRMHIDNSGVVRITSVTVRFSQLPGSFELQSSQPAGTLSADGGSVTFPLSLDPGQGIDLNINYVPHQTGAYHVSIQFFLQDQTSPLVLDDGTQAIDVPITVH